MKYATQLRRAAPTVRTPPGRRTASALARVTLPITAVLALVASALLTGATFAAAMELLPTTVPTLLVGWTAAIGLTFALPLVAVRVVVAALERLH
jgi:hypothetical protein